MPAQRPIGLGIVGCGGFGLFALQHFTQVPGVKLVGIAETHREAAFAAARRFHIPEPMSLDDMLKLPDLDLVYVSTPPFMHYPQALKALEAGKHVIVEKPTALKLAQAEELIALARERDVLMVTNLMQRYNPLFDKVKEVVERRPLGEPLHGIFENYAADEGLGPDHWFWDRTKSGGIFIEHAVHFFDLFVGWLGPGQVVAAQVSRRPGTTIEDQVQATVRYRDDVLVNFYHGFTQPNRLDRQELRILFERGDLRMHEWIPVQARLHALVDEEQTRTLCEIFPGTRLDVTAYYGGKDRTCSGRHKPVDVYQLAELTYGLEHLKTHRYGELLRDLLQDQLAWIADRKHVRKITEQNGRDALAMAEAADRMAHA
jgi:predicted dehydrogenase